MVITYSQGYKYQLEKDFINDDKKTRNKLKKIKNNKTDKIYMIIDKT